MATLIAPGLLPERVRTSLNAILSSILAPAASATPASKGDLLIEATSDTSLTFKYKGSDGTVRSASLTLS